MRKNVTALLTSVTLLTLIGILLLRGCNHRLANIGATIPTDSMLQESFLNHRQSYEAVAYKLSNLSATRIFLRSDGSMERDFRKFIYPDEEEFFRVLMRTIGVSMLATDFDDRIPPTVFFVHYRDGMAFSGGTIKGIAYGTNIANDDIREKLDGVIITQPPTNKNDPHAIRQVRYLFKRLDTNWYLFIHRE